MNSFKTVGIIARLNIRNVGDSVEILELFLRQRGITIAVEQDTATLLPGTSHAVLPTKKLGQICDLIVVVGGDGSLLGAGRELAECQVPVIGINRGALGFLADISPDAIEQKLGQVLDGDFVVDQRFLLQAEVYREGVHVGSSSALNDVVVHPGTMSRMLEFSVWVDGQFVYDQRSDGLIVASPTGSTAYALSAGGPIMHPNLDAIVIVPMFPHTLTSRPLVIPGDTTIRVIVGHTTSTNPQVSCDSQVDIDVQVGDEVHIRKHPHKLRLLYPVDHSFYGSCRSKLDWASRLGGRSHG
jgi:NAD+ kinase